jgi:hypothetical protein
MHALAVGLHERDEPWIAAIPHVVDAKARIDEFVAASGAGLVLRVRDHEIADDANLVRVRELVQHHQPAHDRRFARVGNVEDRRPLRPVLVADIGVLPLDRDLPAARELGAREMTNVGRRVRRRLRIAGMKDIGHVSLPRYV